MKTKKSKLLKRALAALLTMTMALGVVPMTAFAEETSQTAQETAAMRALESRVFEIGDEQLTIEDLEQCAGVFIVDETDDMTIVSGNEIRSYMLERAAPNEFVGGIANFKVIRTTSMSAYIEMTIKLDRSFNITLVEGMLYCSDTSDNYYYRNPSQLWGSDTIQVGTLWAATPSKPAAQSITVTFPNFTLTPNSSGKVGIKEFRLEVTGQDDYAHANDLYQFFSA